MELLSLTQRDLYDVPLVKVLLDAGADVNARNSKGMNSVASIQPLCTLYAFEGSA